MCISRFLCEIELSAHGNEQDTVTYLCTLQHVRKWRLARCVNTSQKKTVPHAASSQEVQLTNMLTHADVATSTQPMSYDSNYSRSEL